jgi:hypothetical protein
VNTTNSLPQEHHDLPPLLTDHLLGLLPGSRPLQRPPQCARESVGSMVRVHAERCAGHGDHVLHDARGRLLRAVYPLDDCGQDPLLQAV